MQPPWGEDCTHQSLGLLSNRHFMVDLQNGLPCNVTCWGCGPPDEQESRTKRLNHSSVFLNLRRHPGDDCQLPLPRGHLTISCPPRIVAIRDLTEHSHDLSCVLYPLPKHAGEILEQDDGLPLLTQ